MAIDLTKTATYGMGHDSIVVRHFGDNIKGGKVLDVTGFSNVDVIKAGHVIIKETATETYKPMPVSNGAYASLPNGHVYVGILEASIATDEPFASILIAGEVNDSPKVLPYDITSIKAAFKAAVPTINFDHD